MAKIPFDIKYRPQIESGEYKVETDSKEPVTIIKWDLRNDDGNIFCYYFDGREEIPYVTDGRDLFIVTPEEELTEFEKELVEILKCLSGRPSEQTYEDYAKEQTAELLSLAIDARAKELSKGLKQSKLDKDSIPYHLIEFMCNLYDCPNWKEIEETAELYVARIKAAAMKDLPRWEKCVSSFVYGNVDNGVLFYKYRYIHLSDLEKLPGFKED